MTLTRSPYERIRQRLSRDGQAIERGPGSAIIEALNASREYRIGNETVHAVREASLKIPRGRFITLVGRSGSGKTTLMNLLAGLDHPTSGQVFFEGRDMASFSEKEFIELRRRRVGVVFQGFALLPLLSAYENVELPLRIAGIGAKERAERTREVLEMVGLGRRAKHRPFELSGGEQQRVSIARAVAMRPDVILADEPTGELDSVNAGAIFGLFRQMVATRDMTIVATTHDRTLLDLADEIHEMQDGVLTLRQRGRTAQPAAPADYSRFRRPAQAH
jgi:ABC-type lipoprotein export system ATPase subunit